MNNINISFSKFFLIAIAGLCIHSLGFAQERGNDKPRSSPNASVSQTIGTTEVAITYGRPGVKDRTIFGDLVPYGNVWRTGANESTVITFSDDVTVGGKSVKAGTYSLYSIPGEEQWTFILNSKLSWGTEYDESEDVIRFKAKPTEAASVENMLFSFTDLTDNSATLVLRWEDMSVPFTIKV